MSTNVTLGFSALYLPIHTTSGNLRGPQFAVAKETSVCTDSAMVNLSLERRTTWIYDHVLIRLQQGYDGLHLHM